MKNKVLLLMVLFLVGCNVGESSSQESSLGQTSKETNYYKPTIKEEYKEISKDDFVDKVNSNYKSEFGYKYISLKVDWDNPEAEYYYYHFRGEVKDDLSLDNKDLFIQNLTGINISKPINAADFYATLYVNPLIKIDEGIKFYESPYSYDFETKGYKGRVIFDDSFMIHKIECVEDGNDVTYDFRYYNLEDLTKATGEVSLDSYLDMAYAYLESDKKLYSGMKTNYKVTNGVVDYTRIYDPIFDTEIIETTYGDVEAEFYCGLKFYYPWVEDASEVELGILDYAFSFDSDNYLNIISGQMNTDLLSHAIDEANFNSKKSALSWNLSNNFMDIKMLNEENNYSNSVIEKYYANPLKRKTEFRKYGLVYHMLYAEYNDRGAITYYKETKDEEKYEYRYIYA